MAKKCQNCNNFSTLFKICRIDNANTFEEEKGCKSWKRIMPSTQFRTPIFVDSLGRLVVGHTTVKSNN
jgi:hypothetical protein